MRSETPGAQGDSAEDARPGRFETKRRGFWAWFWLLGRRCNGLAANSSAGSVRGLGSRGSGVGQQRSGPEMCRAHPCAWGPGNVRHAALAPTRPGASQKPAIVAPTEPQSRSGTSSHSHAAPCRRTPEPRQPWQHTTLPPTGTAMAQNRRGGGFLPPCRAHTAITR